MPDAAVPQAVAEALGKARPMPGHVFSLYLPFWRGDKWLKAGDEAKREALQSVCRAPHDTLAEELIRRQKALAGSLSAETITATSLSPFVTGMGEEHAVENGFAFLSPYGLPYLAGSGVKGVIRRAAEELAQGLNPQGTFGWTHTRVMWLFGYERRDDLFDALNQELYAPEETGKEANALLEVLKKDKNTKSFDQLGEDASHFKGALSFWDVIINGELGIDILTPHYGHYYQGKEPPHDAGQPVPNPFLVVKPGATFTFHITCNEQHLPDSLKVKDKDNPEAWRQLIQAAFDHAFTWAGFGAKTAAGYGVLETESMRKARQKTAMANTPPKEGDKVIIADKDNKFYGRKGEILKILHNPVTDEQVAQLRAIDDGGKIKGMIPLKGLQKIPDEK